MTADVRSAMRLGHVSRRRPDPDLPSRTRNRVVNLSIVVVFAAAYALSGDLLTATWALGGAAIGALIVEFLSEARLARFALIALLSSALSIVLALVFHEPGIIKVEATVIHAAVGLALLAALAFGLNPLQIVFGDVVDLPDETWHAVALRYALFTLALAAANEAVVLFLSNGAWVLFKFPGEPVLHALFAASQLPAIAAGRRTQAERRRSPSAPTSMSVPDHPAPVAGNQERHST